MAVYYDNRRAAVTVTLDDWTEDSEGIWDEANRILTNARIHYTTGIMTDYNPDWSRIQYWYDQGYMEPGSHTRTHPCSDEQYQSANGFNWQIAGARDDILANLNLRNAYVPAFISPCGSKSPAVRQAIVDAHYISDQGPRHS